MKVSMPQGSTHGWGIAGTHLAEEIAKLPPVDGVTLHCITGHDFEPFDKSAWDNVNIGYCFFEHDLLARPFMTRAEQSWNHIVAGSSWCEQQLRKGGMERTSTILQGIDHSRFLPQPPRLDDGRFIVFSGGKFEFRKGQDIVIAAMRIFMERHNDAWLSCSWYNQWPSSIKTMQQTNLIDFKWREVECHDLLLDTLLRNGLDTSRILLHPPFKNPRMPLIYTESDIGIFPNRCEGGNNMVMCEYMACGRTVIASDCTGHADVITDGNALRLRSYRPVMAKIDHFDTGNWLEASPDELLDHLETAYHERQLLKSKGTAAAQDMVRLSWKGAAAKFHSLAVRLAIPRLKNSDSRVGVIKNAEVQFHQGRYTEAEQGYREALSAFPFSAPLHNSLATVLDRMGRYTEAIAHYTKALTLQPGNRDFMMNLANTFARAGFIDEAITELSSVVTLHTECLEAWQSLAHCFKQKGNQEDALRCLEQVARLSPPENSEHLLELAEAYEKLRRFADTLACLDSALSYEPDSVSILNSRGLVLHELGRLEEAEASYDKALSFEPRNAVLCNNLGNIFKSRTMIQEAITCYDRALAAEPDNATIIFNRSLAYLMLGAFQRGWPGYERRFDMIPPVTLPHLDIPLWDGTPLNGRRLLIQAEQVYGDTFMFVRFAHMATRYGGPVIFECQDTSVQNALCHLEREMEALIVRGEPLPAIDLRIPLLSLPGLFGITLDSIPYSRGYLKADPVRIEKWKRLIPKSSKELSVGLVWGGRKAPLNADRSMPLSALEAVLKIPGIRFFSLQLGEDAQQICEYASISELGGQLQDFGETAAAMTCLDLVITIDTAVAHLAGAMGVPVWIMLKFSPDWRWLLGRNDSPWYASARLYRQDSPGDWMPVTQAIAGELKKIVAR